MEWSGLIQGVAGLLLGSGIASYIAWRKLRPEIRKTEAETAEIVGQAWQELLNPLREEIASLRKRVTELECEIQKRDEQRSADQLRIKELEDEVAILKSQIQELGHKPRTRRSPE